MSARYAIYFSPAEQSPLFRQGVRWLGYDAVAGTFLPAPVLDGVSEDEWRAATEAPRKYGFHATLKPPFRLAAGTDEQGLAAKLADFAQLCRPIDAGVPVLTALDGFLAFTPATGHAAISELAAACVAGFDQFRAPAEDAELERRRRAGLSPGQERLLLKWGYPYVMEAFRFHMTLTGRLDEPSQGRFRAAIRDAFDPARAEALTVDSLSLFVQPSPDSRFEIRHRFPFGG